MIFLNIHEFNPRIVFASFYSGVTRAENTFLDQRYIYDYEIELVTEVIDGYMLQNKKHLPIEKGDLIFRRPGEITQGCLRYSSYVICFEAVPSNRNFDQGYYLEDKKKLPAYM